MFTLECRILDVQLIAVCLFGPVFSCFSLLCESVHIVMSAKEVARLMVCHLFIQVPTLQHWSKFSRYSALA